MLKLSNSLSLPLDAVTETFGILATKGAGKSNAAVVMAEEMFKAGLPFVAIDPKGDWWGMRSSADGKKPGLPIPIFGPPSRRKKKPNPDLPLEPEAGKFMANLVVDERISCILDVSGFSEAAKIRFLLDFATELFARNEEPLHLFLEEADDYIPQKPFKEQTRLVHIFSKIVKMGRNYGLGATIISQRSAVVNKNVLTQVSTLIPMYTSSPQDINAILEWVRFHGQSTEIVKGLASFEPGEALVWSPSWLKIQQKIRFRRRQTFDSGATPKVSGKRIVPKSLADIDLNRVREKMSEAVERQEASDPGKLRDRIRELEKALREAPSTPVEKVVEKRVDVPYIPDEVIETARKIILLAERLEDLKPPKPFEIGRGAVNVFNASSEEPKSAGVADPSSEKAKLEASTELSSYALSLLEAIAQRHPMKMSQVQVAMFSKRSHRSSAFAGAMAELRRGDYIESDGGLVRLSEKGIDALDGPVKTMTSEEGRRNWLQILPNYEATLLEWLIDAYPDALSQDELAERSGRSRTSSAFAGAISTLRKNGLVEKHQLRAHPDLFD